MTVMMESANEQCVPELDDSKESNQPAAVQTEVDCSNLRFSHQRHLIVAEIKSKNYSGQDSKLDC